jgi:hypothetical protein
MHLNSKLIANRNRNPNPNSNPNLIAKPNSNPNFEGNVSKNRFCDQQSKGSNSSRESKNGS